MGNMAKKVNKGFGKTSTAPSTNIANMLTQARTIAQQGNVELALQQLSGLLEQFPDNVDLWKTIVEIKIRTGNKNEAIAQLKEAVAKFPNNRHLRQELAIKLMDTGALEEASQQAALLIKQYPKEFNYWNLSGVILKRLGRYDEALEALKQSAKLNQTAFNPWVNMGNIYNILENWPKAVECFTKATKLNIKDGESYRLLGWSYLKVGNFSQAQTILKKALVFSPGDIRCHHDYAYSYFEAKEYAKSFEVLEQSIERFPQEISLLRLKAFMLGRLGRIEESIALYNHLLEKNPQDTESMIRLGNVYYNKLDDRKTANELYAKVLELQPNNEYALSQYVESLKDSRYGSEAEHFENCYHQACKLMELTKNPLNYASSLQGIFTRALDFEHLAKIGSSETIIKQAIKTQNSGMLHFQMSRVETEEDRYALLKAHQEWAKKLDSAGKNNPINITPKTSKSGKIRIGFMSPDLRNHPVSYFLQPILEKYDKENFEIYCYSFYPKEPDQVQQHFSKIVDEFRVIVGGTDQEVAQTIADDQLDIFFELAGTTRLSRLEVMAYRPAPIQVSWLGYPHSLGLSTIDYILVDPYIKPEKLDLISEKPFELLESWVCLGSIGFSEQHIDPEIPEDRRGYITFGTMNSPYKYSELAIATWSKILHQVPDSRFLIVRPETGSPCFQNNAIKAFASHGIDSDRLEFLAVRGKHMQYYNNIDISLDTFPHVGGTTTCETLWMGVPVISLVGPAFYERLSYSNLSNAGLGDLCAFTQEEYIQKAVALAADKERRQFLRTNLRQQIGNHPLGDATRFVRNFEAKIRQTVEGN